MHKPFVLIIVTLLKMSIHDFTKITVLFFKIFPYFSQTQLSTQLLPEAVRCCRCFWHGGMHQNGVRADGLNLPPRDGQTLVPTQQTKKSWPAQQDQALQLRRCGIKLQIIRTAKAYPLLQLNDLFLSQFPDRHGTLPFLPQHTPGRHFLCQRGGKHPPGCGILWKISEKNIQYKRGSSKSIIFDIGGVLVDFDPKAYLVDRLCNAEMEEKVYDLTFGSEEWQLLDAGKLSRYDGNQRMLEHARAEGCAFEVQGVLDDWMHILRPRLRMLELVRRLKSHGYCVYYLSNIPQDVLELLIERGVLAQFDGGVASCEVQVNKPDPQIYKALLKKYQLKASECVFIDDRLENVQAAFALGFAGIQMKDSVGTLIRSLATCNVTLR